MRVQKNSFAAMSLAGVLAGLAGISVAQAENADVTYTARGVPPNMEHLQHFHGFAKGDRTSRCPTTRDGTNRDGIIDIVETEPVAGTTMVPFDDDPVGMSMVNDTFPRAGADGSYSYEKTVSLKALEAAFTKKFPGQRLDLDRRVVFLHGVLASTKLPATAASLDHIPARVVLPIACGAIKKVRD